MQDHMDKGSMEFCSVKIGIGGERNEVKIFISKEWYDVHGFLMDTTVEGEEAPHVFSMNQLHM